MQQRFAISWHLVGLGALVLATAAWSAGCDSGKKGNTAGGGHGHDHGDHDHGGHDHAHDHAHGPHGGEIIEIGDEEYHAEYLKNDGTVTIYVLDASLKNEVPIAAEEIAIETKIGDRTDTFVLSAVDRSEGDEPKTAKFELVDKQLTGVLGSLGEGVTATLKLEINGKPYEAKIEKVDHHH